MAEGIEFYKEQMRQMRVQRDAHSSIVNALREELAECKDRIVELTKELSLLEKKKPAVKRTRK